MMSNQSNNGIIGKATGDFQPSDAPRVRDVFELRGYFVMLAAQVAKANAPDNQRRDT